MGTKPTEALPEDVDRRLLITMSDCPGPHYLVDSNPHTFPGRMHAYCALQGRYTRVSKAELVDCSPEAALFIRGYLAGNEPGPPVDEFGDILPDEADEMATWRHAVQLFRSTGYWRSTPEACQNCNRVALPSDPLTDDRCVNCRGPI